jgi:F-type H+-transporting ATPase subunit delta
LIQTRIISRYISALLEIAAVQGKTADIEQELQLVDQLLKENPELLNMLLHPKISRMRKKKLLDDILGTRISAEARSFLHLLVEKKREGIIPFLFDEFKKAADRLRGVINATVKSAMELSSEQKQKLQSVMEKITSRAVKIAYAVDTALLGGLQVFIGNEILDGSIQGRLNRLQKHLLERNVS